MSQLECTADDKDKLYCPKPQSEFGRPDAIPSKLLHAFSSGDIVFKIFLGCNNEKLNKTNGIALMPKVLEAIKEAIVFLSNLDSYQGIETRHVDLTFMEGLPGVMEATVRPRSADIQKQFSKPEQIRSELSDHIGRIEGIDAACPNLNAAVTSVSKPMVKVCPRAYCGADANKLMRSHGSHTECQPKNGASVPGQKKEAKDVTLGECQQKCTADEGCYGVDYEKWERKCRIWKQPLQFCTRVPASDGIKDMKTTSECFSKCHRKNSPIVLQQPDWMAWIVA